MRVWHLCLCALGALGSGCLGSKVIVGSVDASDDRGSTSDAAFPDVSEPDVPHSDGAIRDVALPDTAVADVSLVDAGRDVSSPDVPPTDAGGCVGLVPAAGTPCSVGVGACARSGSYVCRGDLGVTLCDALPAAATEEACNGVDDDCDGVVDDGLTRACYTGPAGTSGVGTCHGGTQACVGGAWGPCASQVLPVTESCDGLDNNCNGSADESLTRACGDLSWSTFGRYVRGPVPDTSSWLDVCGAPGVTRLLMGVDDGTVSQALPFPFTAFGAAVSTVNLAANGTLSFGSFTGTLFANTTLPAMGGARTVFAFWDDLYAREGICVATVGASPTRRFVAQWNDASVFPIAADTHLSFEVVLHEGTFILDVRYQRLDSTDGRALGSSATIGLQGDDAMSTDLVSFNTPMAVAAGRGFRWTPGSTTMRGICRAGSQSCAAGTWGTCAGAVGPMARELCGNGLDDDCNDRIDDGCM